MAKYAVRLEGGGCLVKIQEHFLGFFRRPTVKCKGFFTTRFIEAASPHEAAVKATDMVRQEMKQFLSNEPHDPWTLSVLEVWEDPQQFDSHAPGSGCTWFEPTSN